MARGRGRRGGGGRIRPVDRNTDDYDSSIASGERLRDTDAAAIEVTESKSMTDKCRKDYRQRNKRFWCLSREYPQVCHDGTRILDADETAVPNKYHFGHTCDLVYSGFRVDIFKAWIFLRHFSPVQR